MANFFTDAEYRILLSALSRERKVCEDMDSLFAEKNITDVVELVPIIRSIEKKIKKIQYND